MIVEPTRQFIMDFPCLEMEARNLPGSILLCHVALILFVAVYKNAAPAAASVADDCEYLDMDEVSQVAPWRPHTL